MAELKLWNDALSWLVSTANGNADEVMSSIVCPCFTFPSTALCTQGGAAAVASSSKLTRSASSFGGLGVAEGSYERALVLLCWGCA